MFKGSTISIEKSIELFFFEQFVEKLCLFICTFA